MQKTPNTKALHKRQKISKANRTMFLWVAGASVILAVSVVVSIFLIQKIIFAGKLNAERGQTIANLNHNNDVIEQLKSDVRALNANASLNSVKANPDDKALQVILDALPADANSLALGASLQQKLAADISGLTVESLSVTSVDATLGETAGDATAATDANGEEIVNGIPFTMTVKAGSYDVLKEFLTRLEKSIRTVQIDNLQISVADSEITMTLEGQGFYEPGKVIELKDKTIKNDGSDGEAADTKAAN